MAKTPTPDQIAKYGHISAAIRKVIQEENISPADFHQKIGLKRASTTVYAWMNCRGAPNPVLAKRINKQFNIPISELQARELVIGEETVKSSKAITAYAPKSHDVLSFTVDNTGQARMKLDVSLPVLQAMPIFRMLLDAGLVMTKTEDTT